MTTQYDSASFEADLGKVEEKFKELMQILDSEQFRGHIDQTDSNFNVDVVLVMEHEEVMADVLKAKCAFDTFAERIRNVG